MVESMRASGLAITYDITISIAKGLIQAHDRTLLKENGGSIELHQSWAQSIFRRLGYVKRRATTAKQPVAPGLIQEIGFTFHSAIEKNINAYRIPHDLVINIDQTPLKFYLTPTSTSRLSPNNRYFWNQHVRRISSDATYISREDTKMPPQLYIPRRVSSHTHTKPLV